MLFRPRPLNFPKRDSPQRASFLADYFERLRQDFEYAENEGFSPAQIQSHIMPILRNTVNEARRFVAKQFMATNDGLGCGTALASFMDALIIGLYRLATQTAFPAGNTAGENLQLVAIGGYGRGMLAPHSDIDLMFLLPYKRTPRIEQVIEFILYILWDIKLKVGHSVRSLDECIRLAKTDMVIRTTLLDLRPLAGDETLSIELERRLGREILHGSEKTFVTAKRQEREERLERTGDSRYRLEPNIKDGKGGLRDLQLLFWIAAHLWSVTSASELVERGVFLPQEKRRYKKALTFLWTVRFYLHLLVGRAEERLTFDVQREIARRLGYTDRGSILGVERFMKHYFLVAKEVGELKRIFMASVEAEFNSERRFFDFVGQVDGFPIRQDRLTISDPKHFETRPLDLLRIFLVAQKTGRLIHPRAESAISRSRALVNPAFRADPEANALFLEILQGKNPHEALRAMNEAGILGRFLTDWGRVVGQMQYDMYHVYTVDEHTIHAITNLARIDNGELADTFPLATAIMKTIKLKRELYLALLLHDIAKGRGGDHSTIGAQIAMKLGHRLGLSEAETETVSWLVRWHLAMSDVALKRDLEDEQTITDFLSLVQSPERLRLLLVLTTCDIHAVGPGRWNNWKAGLLSELYARASDRLSDTQSARGFEGRVQSIQDAVREKLIDWSEEELQRFFHFASPAYWLAYDADTHVRHGTLIREAESKNLDLTVATRVDGERAVTEIIVYAKDHPHLFSQLAGSIATAGFSIVDAKISTLANGMALDVFTVQDASGGTSHDKRRSEKLPALIQQGLNGKLHFGEEFARRGTTLIGRAQALPAASRVIIDNGASQTNTIVEINGRDRPGLLYALARVFNNFHIQISSAKIATYGHRVVDVFYIRDVYGLKIIDDDFLRRIHEDLLKVLTESFERTAS